MNFKTTYILIAIVLLLVGVFFWAIWQGPSTESSTYVLPSMHDKANPLDPQEVERVEIQRVKPEEMTLVFEKDPASKQWRITAPRSYRGEDGAINDLIRQVYGATREKETERLTNLGQYGLEPPNEVITLQKGERQVRLNVGNVSPGPASGENTVIYVTSSDQPKDIMAVKRRSLDTVLKGLADFRSRELLGPSAGDIEAFKLTETTKDKTTRGSVELKKSSEDRWVYVLPPYGDAEASGTDQPAPNKPPGNVQAALTDISNLKVDGDKDFVADDVTDLAKYNLDPAKDKLLRIEIDRVEQIARDSQGKREKKTVKVALVVGVGKKVDDKSDRYYAYLDDPKHKDVVKLPADKVQPLLNLLDKPDALRDRNLVDLGGFRKPDAIDVKNSWGLLEFRQTGDIQKTWKLYVGDKSYAVDEPSVQGLISALTQKDQATFPEASVTPKQLGLDKPEEAGTIVTVWADSLPPEKKDGKKDDKKDDKKAKKPEPKEKDKPAFRLFFGSETQGKVAVLRKRGSETGTLVLVPLPVRDQVRREPLAYLDKRLPQFNAGAFVDATKNVTKLALTRDGTTFEISHADKADAPWKIEAPKEFAGRTADRMTVDDILRELNSLRAVKIVADKTTDARLTEYGLKSPRYKAVVTVTKDGKPATYEYDFGKEADDKSGAYLHTNQQDTISVVGNSVLTTLQKELREPTVVQFDPAKVKEVKFTGWVELVGPDYVLDAKKKGADWTVEKPAGFKLDAGKLRTFLAELSHLKALKFVAKSAPEQGLDVAKGALKIEIRVEGEKEPLTLTVGKPDGDNAFFAISSKLPGEVFDVRKDLFDGPKMKPVYFAK